MKPLENITVIDFSSNLPGPLCSSILIQLGARVIKVESPDGDPFRHSGEMWTSLNLGKESVSVNLKTESGKKLVTDLVRIADIVIEGWRPGVAARLGVDYTSLKKVNDKLIYCSISGYGQNGPWSDRTGHDVNYLASSGYYSIDNNAENLEPPTILLADVSSGFYACILILSYLPYQNQNQQGCYIDLSMAESVLSLLNLEFVKHHSNSPFKGKPNVTHLPHYNIFKCADDLWITLGIVDENHFWKQFCDVTGLNDMGNWDLDKRIKNAQLISNKLTKLFFSRTAKEWEHLLLNVNVPVAVVNTIEEVINNPQFAYRGIWSEYNDFHFAGLPAVINSQNFKISVKAPVLGEHTDKIVKELHYSEEQIDKINDEKSTLLPLKY